MNRLFQSIKVASLITIIAVGSGLLASFKTYTAAGGTVHMDISAHLKTDRGFSEASFSLIDEGNTSQDVPLSDNFGSPAHHFDNNGINDSISYFRGLVTEVVNLAMDADVNKQNRHNALIKLGLLLHTVQDFYSHSNYLEINLKARKSNIPVIDWNKLPAGLKTGYFGSIIIDEEPLGTALKDLSKAFPGVKFKTKAQYQPYLQGVFTNGTYKDYNSAIKIATDSFAEMHYYLNMDNASTTMGSIVKSGTNKKLFDLAVELAVKETLRQWDDIEKQIRQKLANDKAKADRIISALKMNP